MRLCEFDSLCPAFAVEGSSFCPVHRWAFNHKREWEVAMKAAARHGQPKCDECDGEGQIECDNCSGNGETDACECPNCYGHDCEDCDGVGHTKCEACNGVGIQAPEVEPAYVSPDWPRLELLEAGE
jgi:hypothetical protein